MGMGKKQGVFTTFFIIFVIISVSGFLIFDHFSVNEKVKTTNVSKPPTKFTKKSNNDLLHYLDFDDQSDIEDANRGFIGTLKDPVIKNKNGDVIFDPSKLDFINATKSAPDTVNPSLWRQSQLTAIHGLFKVNENIYQIRGLDLANMTLIKSENGWIIVDPLTSVETAKVALELAEEHLGKINVKAIILTHSHADHFGGIRGIVDEKSVESGDVQVIAPLEFFEESVSENLLAGNTMLRRSSYMYGNILPYNEHASVGVGLGAAVSSGEMSIIHPTLDIIEKKPVKIDVDGLEILFMYAPDAEAPSELLFYVPRDNALCQAEEISHTLHNLLTLRGAKVRNGLYWSQYIKQVIEEFGNEVEISFGSHHWPMWGNERILEFWKLQRDLYKYIHDESLYLANTGLTINEIGEKLQLPEAIDKKFYNRGYYGSVIHNAKAQYQMYFGFFSGNPEQLHVLPPVELGKKFVEYMGGADNVMRKALKDYNKGEYRWVATALNHVVFADPNNQDAKNLLADAYEQMGYQSENATWRNFYMGGAQELRNGVNKNDAMVMTISEDMINNLPISSYLDYVAVRMNHQKAAKIKPITMNFEFSDIGQKFVVFIENGVLHYTLDKNVENAHVKIEMNRSDFNDLNAKKITFEKLMDTGGLKIDGDTQKFKEFVGLLDNFDFWFNIVTP